MRTTEILEKNGWMVAAILVVSVIFWHAHLRVVSDYQFYQSQLEALQESKTAAQRQNKRLQAQLASADDQAWLEWNLMHLLGLTPENATKVLLKEEPAI